MFKKINAVFRPTNGQRSQSAYYSEVSNNASTVRLVRSTSVLTVSESQQRVFDSTLKRSKSSVNIESTAAFYYYHQQEDRIWLYSQRLYCLQYLEDLVAFRRQYDNNLNHFKCKNPKAPASSEKKSPPIARHEQSEPSKTKASAPPIPTEKDTLEFFDSVIASCDLEPKRKPYFDDEHADVDFIVATSTSDHDLHSNWVLRDPRRFSAAEAAQKRPGAPKGTKGGWSGSVRSWKQLQRNPIHLPKVVESAFQTLRFKPKLKKKE